MTESQLWAALNGVMGLVLVGYGGYGWLQARATRAWPSVAGKLLSARVTAQNWRGNTSYYVHLEYEYVVDAHTYRGARRAVGGAVAQSEHGAELLRSRYNVGETVWVFYKPAQPGEAVLEHAAPAARGIMLAGAMFLGFAVLFALKAAT